MADLPAPFLAESRRPWPKPEVAPAVKHCPACFGALPPDTTAACSDCGEGTPPGLTVLQPLAAPAAGRTSWATWPNPLEPDNFTNMTDAGWGAADVGSAWTTVTSGSADFSTAPLVTGLPHGTPSTTDHIGDEEWGRQQIVTMRQATFTPTGPPHFPVPSLSETPLAEMVPPGMTLWVQLPDGRRQVTGQPRRSWWRRIWRRRG